MKPKKLTYITAITLFAALAIPVRLAAQAQTPPTSKPNSAPGDFVIQWNQVLRLALSVPGPQHPTLNAGRKYTMTHLAIFDAVNADGCLKTYFARVKTSRGASIKVGDTAAVQPLCDALQ
jgi:hypothetical protein